MSRALERIVPLLGELSAAELEQLSAKVAALRALSGPAASSSPGGAAGHAASDEAAFSFLLYAALATFLAQEGATSPPYASFLRTRPGALYVRAAEAAGRVHARFFPKATRTETAALCRIYARSLLNYLEATKRPLQWPAINSALFELPTVLDHAFPGYARNGAMSMLLRQPESVGM